MRYWFGGSPADYVISPGQQVQITTETIGYQTILVPGVRLWCYDYDTGDRTTDLLDASGSQVDHLVTVDYGAIPRFRGPDEVRRLLIGPEPADPGAGAETETPSRWIITSTDWPTIVSSLATRVTALEDTGGGGGEPIDAVATAHPLVWSLDGEAETRTSPHSYWNLEGKGQTVTKVRAQGNVIAGTLAVHVLTIDPVTQATTIIAALLLDSTNPHATTTVDAAVSDGTGLTVAVELGSDGDQIEDVTVQVMLR
ncbi:hypothetical protein [Nocardiopsis sp. FR26]|uniref:hypothetical protein n=1 Tax=Nocardiopsis sp. FR26 TaxID=2605987 RepID=UPI0013577919|nr:hypothetical protein [Nocardiopsis sp. FR26]